MTQEKTLCCCSNSDTRHLSEKNDKTDLKRRLKRIEGQIKGIQNMIDDDRYCMDILIQVSAAKAAIDRVGKIILENHVKGCIADSIKNKSDEDSEKMIEELMDNIYKFMK